MLEPRFDPNASQVLKLSRTDTHNVAGFLLRLSAVKNLPGLAPQATDFFDEAITQAMTARSPGMGLVMAAAVLGAASDSYTTRRCLDFLGHDSPIAGNYELLRSLAELDVQAALSRNRRWPVPEANEQLLRQVAEAAQQAPQALGSLTLLAYFTGAVQGADEQTVAAAKLREAIDVYAAFAESQEANQG